MIRIVRMDLDERLSNKLSSRTTRLTQREADSISARRSWKSAVSERSGIKMVLSRMATGIERCMYCGDSRGTDIDHFEPIVSAPFRTFEWQNHLLACASCNSNAKRHSYPRDASGGALLINPTLEDPSEHLDLTLSEGRYEGTTPKGCMSIHVFQLNRVDLEMGRSTAFARCKSMLRDYLRLEAEGRLNEAAETKLALQMQPFADVLHAMYRSAQLPGAVTVLGGTDVVKLLIRWREES